MLETVVRLQRDIYLTFGGHIRAFAEDGSWQALAAFLPLGIVFGAAHALAPGHGKAVLATYLTGASTGMARGLLVSLALSATHVAMAVVVALLALPLVTRAVGDAGRAPLLEAISRGLLGLLGLWMLWRGLRRPARTHAAGVGMAFGFAAGLVPCPLTLFVMAYAIARGVPEAGLAFAAVMMAGVAMTLSAVAAATVLFRRRLVALLSARPWLMGRAERIVGMAAGAILILVAWNALVTG